MADSSSLARVTKMHAHGNQRSRDDWELYRAHRERLTRTIDDVGDEVGCAGGSAPTLVLLGAGNCNDVDLPALAEPLRARSTWSTSTGAAIERARQRQPPGVAERIVTHGGVDLTGLLHRLDRWKNRPPDAATLEQAVAEGVAAHHRAGCRPGAPTWRSPAA